MFYVTTTVIQFFLSLGGSQKKKRQWRIVTSKTESSLLAVSIILNDLTIFPLKAPLVSPFPTHSPNASYDSNFFSPSQYFNYGLPWISSFGWPDDDSLESKRVATSIILYNKLLCLKHMSCMNQRLWLDYCICSHWKLILFDNKHSTLDHKLVAKFHHFNIFYVLKEVRMLATVVVPSSGFRRRMCGLTNTVVHYRPPTRLAYEGNKSVSSN
jgi:hypothetical protein